MTKTLLLALAMVLTITTVRARSIPMFDHIVLVIEENHAFGQIIGNSEAPYINSTLVKGGALMTDSFAITHPSLPNYLAIFSGSTQGVVVDKCPVPGAPFAPSLGGELQAARTSWRTYAESLPKVGSNTCYSAYPFDHDHAPFSSFADDPPSMQLPFAGYWPADLARLPRVAVVIPNVLNDMHDGSIGRGDAWLQRNIGPYAAWTKTHNSLLIVTWDEDNGSDNNRVPTMFYGAGVLPGQYSQHITHYDVIRTLEDMFDLNPIGNTASAAVISDIWGSGRAEPHNLMRGSK